MIRLATEALQEVGSWMFKLAIKLMVVSAVGWLVWRYGWPILEARLG